MRVSYVALHQQSLSVRVKRRSTRVNSLAKGRCVRGVCLEPVSIAFLLHLRKMLVADMFESELIVPSDQCLPQSLRPLQDVRWQIPAL